MAIEWMGSSAIASQAIPLILTLIVGYFGISAGMLLYDDYVNQVPPQKVIEKLNSEYIRTKAEINSAVRNYMATNLNDFVPGRGQPWENDSDYDEFPVRGPKGNFKGRSEVLRLAQQFALSADNDSIREKFDNLLRFAVTFEISGDDESDPVLNKLVTDSVREIRAIGMNYSRKLRRLKSSRYYRFRSVRIGYEIAIPYAVAFFAIVSLWTRDVLLISP